MIKGLVRTVNMKTDDLAHRLDVSFDSAAEVQRIIRKELVRKQGNSALWAKNEKAKRECFFCGKKAVNKDYEERPICEQRVKYNQGLTGGAPC